MSSDEFNLEKFISHRFSKNSEWLPTSLLDWLKTSCENPEAFYQELRPCKEIDFYADAIIQHLDKNRIALTTIDKNGEKSDWSYDKLHYCVNHQVKEWNELGLTPGQHIAIVAPISAAYLVAYLTALRLGLKIAYLPLDDPYLSKKLLHKKLQEIQPTTLITTEKTAFDTSAQIIRLHELPESKNNYSPTSHAYDPSDITQIALGTYNEEFLPITPLNAQALYYNTLRDGHTLFALKPNHTYSAPLTSPLYTHPTTTLSCLLTGARLLYIDPTYFKEHPEILTKEKIHTLGVTKELQKHPIPSSHLKHLHKSPFDQDIQSWKNFTATNKIEKIPISNYLHDNSRGGITLFSKTSLQYPDNFLLPTPATPFQLLDLNGTGAKALNSYGLLEINATKTPFVLAQVNQEYLLSDIRKPARAGKLFPVDQIELLFNAYLHHTLKSGTIANSVFALILFSPQLNTSQIETLITEELGPAYLPDHIENYPLNPKTIDGRVDRNWCEAQYSKGLLHKKRELTIYRKLSELQKLVER